MSKVQNISGGDLDVPLLGRGVADKEIVEVPDFQPAHTDDNPLPIIWPPDKWKPVPEPLIAPEQAAVPENIPGDAAGEPAGTAEATGEEA